MVCWEEEAGEERRAGECAGSGGNLSSLAARERIFFECLKAVKKLSLLDLDLAVGFTSGFNGGL